MEGSDFIECPFCGKAVKYVGFKIMHDGHVMGHTAKCSGNCGWEMSSKSYARLKNKVNKRPVTNR